MFRDCWLWACVVTALAGPCVAAQEELVRALNAAGVVSTPEHNGDRTVLAPPPPRG